MANPAAIQGGIWTMCGVALLALVTRVYSKKHYKRSLWYDDYVLMTSWVMVAIGGGFLTTFAVPSFHDAHAGRPDLIKKYFAICSLFCGLASAWSKSAFAITLLRLTANGICRYFLWFVLVTVNAAYIIFVISPWTHWNQHATLTLITWTVVYSACMDFALTIVPWIILRKSILKNKEKLAVAIAMSFGVLAGAIAIKRVMNMKGLDPNASHETYYGRIIQCVYNLAEPCVTIVAQSIPTLRLLFASNYVLPPASIPTIETGEARLNTSDSENSGWSWHSRLHTSSSRQPLSTHREEGPPR